MSSSTYKLLASATSPFNACVFLRFAFCTHVRKCTHDQALQTELGKLVEDT